MACLLVPVCANVLKTALAEMTRVPSSNTATSNSVSPSFILPSWIAFWKIRGSWLSIPTGIARADFIDDFFTALGWDVRHREQQNPYEQEIKIEKTQRQQEAK